MNLIRIMPAKERESVVDQSAISVIGAGVAGLTCAVELSARGFAVDVVERASALGEGACSWMAGGMLAPWCERATTEEAVARLGAPSIAWWLRNFPGTVQKGSLVVAPPRDAADGAAALLHALLRAAGQSVDDADARARCQAWLPPQGLRDVAARRALWPRLRAMRRGPTA